jgi:hypothetical protein
VGYRNVVPDPSGWLPPLLLAVLPIVAALLLPGIVIVIDVIDEFRRSMHNEMVSSLVGIDAIAPPPPITVGIPIAIVTSVEFAIATAVAASLSTVRSHLLLVVVVVAIAVAVAAFVNPLERCAATFAILAIIAARLRLAGGRRRRRRRQKVRSQRFLVRLVGPYGIIQHGPQFLDLGRCDDVIIVVTCRRRFDVAFAVAVVSDAVAVAVAVADDAAATTTIIVVDIRPTFLAPPSSETPPKITTIIITTTTVTATSAVQVVPPRRVPRSDLVA